MWRENGQCWVDAVLGVCCTQRTLYSVYAVLSVKWWSLHGEIERDDLTICSAMMVELWTRQIDGGWIWEQYGGYEWIWEIRGTTCLIGLRRPRISVNTHWIGTRTCHIKNGKLTPIRNSLKSQFLMMISHLFLILNCTITSEHEVKPSLSISACHDHELTPSTAYTEYCIHRVLHTLSTASSEDWMSPAPSQSLISHLSADLVVLNSLHSHNYELTIE